MAHSQSMGYRRHDFKDPDSDGHDHPGFVVGHSVDQREAGLAVGGPLQLLASYRLAVRYTSVRRSASRSCAAKPMTSDAMSPMITVTADVDPVRVVVVVAEQTNDPFDTERTAAGRHVVHRHC